MSNETPKPVVGPKRSLWQRLVRLITYRLLIPIKRARHAPEYVARGVMVGMAWAMTPFVGIQMYLVFMTWLIARRLFRWDFSLIIGLAWTWTTNVVTVFPIYYVFYLTGQILLGHWDNIGGYASFVGLLEQTFGPDLSLWETLERYGVFVIKDWGLAMAIGSLPWSALGGWLGYRWGLAYARRRRAKRTTKFHSPA
jgi:uncharacterized protein (DUF2062 family)